VATIGRWCEQCAPVEERAAAAKRKNGTVLRKEITVSVPFDIPEDGVGQEDYFHAGMPQGPLGVGGIDPADYGAAMSWSADHVVPIKDGGRNDGALRAAHLCHNQARNRKWRPEVQHGRQW
jgi:hypothetical protein